MSCAAGLAVLDAIAADGLRENATAVGARLRAALRQLGAALDAAGALATVGDVRGAGLFLGIDLVRDRESRAPATAAASVVCSRLKGAHRILTSLDGESDNVVVVKPPLCFSAADADRFVAALGAELGALVPEDLEGTERTPT